MRRPAISRLRAFVSSGRLVVQVRGTAARKTKEKVRPAIEVPGGLCGRQRDIWGVSKWTAARWISADEPTSTEAAPVTSCGGDTGPYRSPVSLGVR